MRSEVARLAVPGVLVALGAACSSLSHQAGFQTEALPLAPGGPVEVGASVAAYGAGQSFTLPAEPGGPIPEGDTLLGTRATGHVRVPLTRGTSLRLGAGYAGVTAIRSPQRPGDTVSGIAGSVSLFHAFRPQRADGTWQGSVMWGGGVLAPQVPLRDLSPSAVTGGAHLGVIGSVVLGPQVHWHAGVLGHLLFSGQGDDDGGVQVRGEGLLVTGPVWHLPVGRDAGDLDRPAREVHVMLEAGFGWASWAQTIYPAGQLTIGTGPRAASLRRR